MATTTSLKDFVQKTVKFMQGGIYDLFGRNTTWSAGEVLKVNPDQTVSSMPHVRFLTVASTDSDISNAKGAGFSQIFNTWSRISYSSGNPHTTPSEESSWTFDATTGRITCPVNSLSFTGFVGPDYYDNYEMEVVISSTDADDDSIGLVLAYIEEGGVAYALMVQRSAGSTFNDTGRYYFNILYNPMAIAGGTPEWQVAGTNGSLHYPDGTAMPTGPVVTNGANGGWGDLGEISLKVTRTPTKIIVATSDKGALSVYKPENTLTIDLNSDDRLTRFIHPCRIGYQCMSQPNSTFRVLSQPDYQAPIFDVRDGSMQSFDGGNWVTHAAGSDFVKSQVPQGILISSIANSSIWYATYDGVLRKISG